MAQTYTSSATSINSTKLPAVYRKANLTAPVVFDYGCGKYTDHIKDYLRKTSGTVLLPFDPFNQPTEVNNESSRYVMSCMQQMLPVDVVCSNVLNVIDDDDTIAEIAGQIERIVSHTNGTGYITVYEGNRSGVGRQTGTDQYQRNEPLRSYLKYFRNARVYKGMIVVER